RTQRLRVGSRLAVERRLGARTSTRTRFHPGSRRRRRLPRRPGLLRVPRATVAETGARVTVAETRTRATVAGTVANGGTNEARGRGPHAARPGLAAPRYTAGSCGLGIRGIRGQARADQR